MRILKYFSAAFLIALITINSMSFVCEKASKAIYDIVVVQVERNMSSITREVTVPCSYTSKSEVISHQDLSSFFEIF